MGVPSLFRWLSQKYPKLSSQVVEEEKVRVGDVEMPIDTTKPNPNGFEIDNLYLDMNGIIHPCCHPEGKPAPPSEDAMLVEIMHYIDRIFQLARPRKLVYMAIDGVAPRAKMNQQRSRRFRAAREAQEKRDKEEQERLAKVDPEEDISATEEVFHFDSNCITPGTPFMDKLAQALRYYVPARIHSDPGWAKVKILLSDASVPGEGEHKIMDYIRRQRCLPGHDPNTMHCLYGLDADLIMLSLATHEPHFKVLREDVFAQDTSSTQTCYICGKSGHYASDCPELKDDAKEDTALIPQSLVEEKEIGPKPYIFFHVEIMREYLEAELFVEQLPFPFNLERAIDDWVFMCCFVGNDFLPHLPSLEIREGAIDKLIKIWKQKLPSMGGYLTESGVVDLERLEAIMEGIGILEEEIFRERREREIRFAEKDKRRKEENERLKARVMEKRRVRAALLHPPPAASANAASESATPEEEEPSSAPETVSEVVSDSVEPPKDDLGLPEDNVRLWETGWKERYYQRKFQRAVTDIDFRRSVAYSYVEGLCWVMAYYYHGCPSWKWYYPHHYAPFASDLTELGKHTVNFELGTPFNPLEQLMGVLPAASGQHIPEPLRRLMSEPDSPILDFYPVDFRLDLNGKKHLWQGVALLPFIDEKRLLDGMATRTPELSEQERKRNVKGEDILYVGHLHPVYEAACSIYGKVDAVELRLDFTKTHGMNGRIRCDDDAILPGSTLTSPIVSEELVEIPRIRTISVRYLLPILPPGVHHTSKLLPGVRMPAPELTPQDKYDVVYNANRRGGRGGGRGGRGGGRGGPADRFIRHHGGQGQGRDRPDRHVPRFHPYAQSGPTPSRYDISGSQHSPVRRYGDGRPQHGGGDQGASNHQQYGRGGPPQHGPPYQQSRQGPPPPGQPYPPPGQGYQPPYRPQGMQGQAYQQGGQQGGQGGPPGSVGPQGYHPEPSSSRGRGARGGRYQRGDGRFNPYGRH